MLHNHYNIISFQQVLQIVHLYSNLIYDIWDLIFYENN